MNHLLYTLIQFQAFLLFFLVGLACKKNIVKRNRFFGVRTKKSLASDEAWRIWNTTVGRDMVRASYFYLVAGVIHLCCYFYGLDIAVDWQRTVLISWPHLVMVGVMLYDIVKLERSE